MTKYYRVDEDDFEALPFWSEMDESGEGHALIIEERFKEDFIAEQIAQFTRTYYLFFMKWKKRRSNPPFFFKHNERSFSFT